MSSLVITIDATPDIVMSGSPTSPTALGVTAYQEPAILPDNTYSPGGPLFTQSALATKNQLSLLNFTVAPFNAANEAAARTLITTLRAAVSRLTFDITVNVDGAGNEVWRSSGAGSVTPVSGRDWVNIRTHITEWNVSIPILPTRVS